MPGPVARAEPRAAALTRAFLLLCGGLLRAVGRFPFKEKVIQNLLYVPWPAVDFPHRTAEVCKGHTISLIPHVGEFDFRALFSKTLEYEDELFDAVAQRMGRYDAVVEIGSNVGVFSLFFAKLRRAEAPVFCFEPSAEAFRRLLDNIGRKPPPNFFLIPAAVSDKCGLLTFYEPTAHLTNGSLLESFALLFSDDVRKNLVPSVNGMALEDLVRPYGSLLLKIDVEGAEVTVIHALNDLILAKRPEIIMEVLDPFVAELNTLTVLTDNYRLFLVTAEGLQEKPRFMGDGKYRDYYLLPK